MNPDRIHVIPLGDFREHEASLSCLCHPAADDDEPGLIVHRAMDGRGRVANPEKAPSGEFVSL